jgi:hypothetical protein
MTGETVLTLKQAATLIGQRTGRKPSITSIWRWTTRGCKGRKLHSYLHGGIRVTTLTAVDAFFASDSTPNKSVPTAQPIAPSGHAQASAECDAAGI